MPLSTRDWFERLTVGELIDLHDQAQQEIQKCKLTARPLRQLTDAENEFRVAETKAAGKVAERSLRLTRRRLAVIGRLLFTLATEETLPGLIDEAIREMLRERPGLLMDQLNEVEARMRSLWRLHDQMKASLEWYSGRHEELLDRLAERGTFTSAHAST